MRAKLRVRFHWIVCFPLNGVITCILGKQSEHRACDSLNTLYESVDTQIVPLGKTVCFAYSKYLRVCVYYTSDVISRMYYDDIYIKEVQYIT